MGNTLKGSNIMKITISGKPKEIAALALELQGQRKEKTTQFDEAVQKQIDLVSKASESCYNQSDFKDLSLLSQALAGLNG